MELFLQAQFRSWFSLEIQLFLTTGILGGFTTFSTFSLDALRSRISVKLMFSM